MILLEAGDYRLELAPEQGGSIARFDWRGEALMRPTCGPSILDTACFPLVPFSNRVAHGRFQADARKIVLSPNFPGTDHPHTLHGFGWLTAWDVAETSPGHAVLRHDHPAGEWPWSYRARQGFHLAAEGLTMTLGITNLGDTPMPVGLGFHPYFPRTATTRYHGLHRGEWHNTADCLPVELDLRGSAIDWWEDAPASARAVDTAYVGREGPLTIEWPERQLGLTLTPSDLLGTTVVYTPADADFFCVEPVSHATDAHNRDPGELVWLEPGQSTGVSLTLRAALLSDGPPSNAPLTTD